MEVPVMEQQEMRLQCVLYYSILVPGSGVCP